MAEIRLAIFAHACGPGSYAMKPINMSGRNGGADALLCPSGCGKSTMLNIISGLLKPSEGRVLFYGQDVTDKDTGARNIAHCKHPLTACWARTHTGQKHPYDLCQYRGCPEKGKSFQRDKLKEEFGTILKALAPARSTFELANHLFRQAWAERSSSVSSEAKRLRAKVRQIELDLENTIQRLARTEDRTMITAYETRVVELKKEP